MFWSLIFLDLFESSLVMLSNLNQSFFLFLFLSFSVLSQGNTDGTSKEDRSLITTPEIIEVNLEVIHPPEGFQVSPSFNGFIHYQASSAIIVNLIKKVNYRKLTDGMNQEFYDKNKLEYISEKKIISDNGTKGIWYKFNFNIEGSAYGRYMVYAGDLNKTLWLNITYPLKLEDLIESQLLDCMQTIDLTKIKK